MSAFGPKPGQHARDGCASKGADLPFSGSLRPRLGSTLAEIALRVDSLGNQANRSSVALERIG
jgi:hypothetical protein